MSDSLEYVTTTAMLNELRRRHDCMVFLGASNRTEDIEDITVGFEGAFHAVLGLIELGKVAVMNGISDDENRASD
tara:strand:- start:900 stop:1124 length:225 start_codon:yes stop_codon:yes gene_type:complete